MHPTNPQTNIKLNTTLAAWGVIKQRLQNAAGPGCGACMGRWWIGVGSNRDGQASRGMDYMKQVEGGACGLGAGQGVDLTCRHLCSEGCSTGFCLWSATASAS
eukprot:1148023-Pelagomonas_calceolata.AAC.1